MTAFRRATVLVVVTILYRAAEGYQECSNAGHELGECMPESQCTNSGGVKGYNSEHRCENDIQSNIGSQEKHVYCTTYGHLAKDLCSTWLAEWEKHDNSCSIMMHARSGGNRVLGGKAADKGEFKHMAAIGRWVQDHNSYKWECGGAIISPHFVLTAAHCVDKEDEKYVVKIGEYDMSKRRETNVKKEVIKMELPVYLHRSSEYDQSLDDVTKQEIVMDVKKVIMYPGYQYHLKFNDIALLELEKPVLLNDFVLPACIPFDIEDQPKIGQELTVAGWGSKIAYGSPPSSKLRKVDVPVVDTAYCQELIWSNTHSLLRIANTITPKQLCAGAKGKDTCSGDSGGALGKKVSREDNGPCGFQAIGIVSFGGNCGLMGVYTRVSSYLNWIMRYLAPDHYYQYISEHIYAGGLEFDGKSMIQFNINGNIFTNGFRIQLYFKTKKKNYILIEIPTTKEGSNITLEMIDEKVVFREPLGDVYLESESAYTDDDWHYLTVECRLSTEHCYLKISEESLEDPWTLSSSSEEGLVDTLFMGGIGEDYKENPKTHYKGSLVYSLSSSLKLNSIKSSYGTVIANNGSSPAGGSRDDADLAVLHFEHREMQNQMTIIERLLQDITAKMNKIMPGGSAPELSASTSSECIPPFILISSTAECLFFGKLPLTLSEAKTSCVIMGGMLAIPDDLAELQTYMLSRDLGAYHWVDGNSTFARSNNQVVHDDCWETEISNVIHTGESCLLYHPSKDGYCKSKACGENVKARYICKSDNIVRDEIL